MVLWPNERGPMKIKLTQNQVALIDEADIVLTKFSWHATKNARSLNIIFYAARTVWISGKSKHIYLHREIMERMIGRNMIKGEEVDHRNQNSLDNRRSNLRLTTHQQNLENQRHQYNKSSLYRGVHLIKRAIKMKWIAYIKHNGKRIHLGSFYDEILAAKAYDEAARLYFGDYAKLNFPEDTEEIMKF